MDNTSIYASIVFFGLLMTPIELVISPLMQLVSRRHEYEADRWAVQTTVDRSVLVSGLKKLAANNLSNLSPHPLFVVLHYSHPPLLERVNAIEGQADNAYSQ
jgi:STE24 endopeptidase